MMLTPKSEKHIIIMFGESEQKSKAVKRLCGIMEYPVAHHNPQLPNYELYAQVDDALRAPYSKGVIVETGDIPSETRVSLYRIGYISQSTDIMVVGPIEPRKKVWKQEMEENRSVSYIRYTPEKSIIKETSINPRSGDIAVIVRSVLATQ